VRDSAARIRELSDRRRLVTSRCGLRRNEVLLRKRRSAVTPHYRATVPAFLRAVGSV
jgi:hypothetical protein